MPAPGNFAPKRPNKGQLSTADKMLQNMAEEMAALPHPVMAQLLPSLHAARKELRADLLQWLKDAPDGANRFTAQAMRNTLLNLEASIEKIKEVHPALVDALGNGGAMAGELSVAHLRREVARMSTVFGESVFNAPQVRAAKVLTSSEKILIPKYRNSANRYRGNVLEDLKHQFGIGVARGETYFQLQQRLRRLGGPKGLVALRGSIGDPRAIVEDISEGLFKRYRHWANRVVRTEMSNAYNLNHEAGIVDLNDQIGDEDDEYLSRWDARNDGGCPICQALDKTAVKVGEQFAPGIYRAPAHPNCFCRIGAWRKDWGDIEGEVALKGPAPGPNAKGWPPTTSGEPGKPGKPQPPPAKVAPSGPAVHPQAEELRKADKKIEKVDAKVQTDIQRALEEPIRLQREHDAIAEDPKLKAEWKKILDDPSPEASRRFDEIRRARSERQKRIDDLYDRIPETKKELAVEAARVKADALARSRAIRAQMTPEERSLHTARVGAETLGEDLAPLRVSIDGDLAAEGFRRRDGDYLSISRVAPQRSGIAATHGWDGEILMSPRSTENSREFLTKYAEDPGRVRKAMKDAVAIHEEAEVAKRAAEAIDRRADDIVDRIRVENGGSYKISEEVRATWRDKAPLPEYLAKHKAQVDEYFKLSQEAIEAKRGARAISARFEKSEGGKLLNAAEGHKTHVHEAFHGHGNIEMAAYRGHGGMVEEVITEVSARDHMVTRWGVPRSWHFRDTWEGSYQGWIREVRQEIAALHKVSQDEAWEILREAAKDLKRTSENIMTPERAVQAMAEAIGKASGNTGVKSDMIQGLQRASDAFAKD